MTPDSDAQVPLFRRALVALHHGERDASLLSYAAMLARERIVGDLHFVHVIPDEVAVDREALLARVEADARRRLGSLPAWSSAVFDLQCGPLLDRLIAYASSHEMALVLVGHREDHSLRRSLARQLTKIAPSDVLMVPGTAPARVRRILAPVDFSPPSAHALGVAVAFAARLGLAAVSALHVYFDQSRTTYDGADELLRGDEAARFSEFVAAIETAGVQVTPYFREGVHPGRTIGAVASELGADLIVMETRGRTASAAILLGSIAQETLVESPCPVLVLKQPGSKVGILRALLVKALQSEPGTQTD